MSKPKPRYKPDPNDETRHVLTLDSIREHWTYLQDELQLDHADTIARFRHIALRDDILKVANERIPDEQSLFRQGLKQTGPHGTSKP